MLPILLAVSIIGFFIVWAQPGDVLSGCEFSAPEEVCKAKREELGLDKPFIVQYLIWLRNIVAYTPAMDTTDPSNPKPWQVWFIDGSFPFVHYRPYFGESSAVRQPVTEALFGQGGKALFHTLLVVFFTTLFVWGIAVPIGIYSATRKYSLGDHSFTFLGFIGLSIPDFLWALLYLELTGAILHVGTWCGPFVEFFRAGAGTLDANGLCKGLGNIGLFDQEFLLASWSWEKFRNFVWHFIPLVVVIGMVNIASIMRYMRSNLLDVLALPYVKTARAKGLEEGIVVIKHAVRNAINPLITMLGYWVPIMFESMMVAAAVLNVQIVEREYWLALSTQDQPVIMAGLLYFSVVLLVGNLIADILLVLSDPRIRYE
jgi:peptide/nickel transport system permease protein